MCPIYVCYQRRGWSGIVEVAEAREGSERLDVREGRGLYVYPLMYTATELQQSCNRAATELQQSCNRSATDLQQSCNKAATEHATAVADICFARVCGAICKKKKKQKGKRKAAAWKQAYHAVMPVSC